MRRGTQFAFAIVAFFSAIGMAHAQFRVDESTGQANYRYEFPLPAARGRFQPTLSLFYGGYSGAPGPDTGYGSGWTSSVPRIMKVGENGATHYYYNEGGSTKPLIPSPRDGSGRYVVDVEERYLSFRQ